MARYDVHPNDDGRSFLLDCQADILNMLTTRLVVPLLAPADGPPPIRGLNPIFRIAGREVVMYTQFAAAVPASDLKPSVAFLKEEDRLVMNALDMLLTGC